MELAQKSPQWFLRKGKDMVNKAIRDLALYGVRTGLITEADVPYVINRLIDEMKLDAYEEPTGEAETDLETILAVLLEDACKRELIPDSIVYKDLFDTKLMGVMTPFPREVIGKFRELHAEDPEKATDWYYDFSCNTDYIRRYRIKKDMRWKTMTEYGEIDITINLSKPEKDPKAIAAAGKAKSSTYPKCLLCMENEGYAGRVNHPARDNHRIIPLTLDGREWGFQYSPYVYYNEHCIVFNGEHVPMKIDRHTFTRLFDFIKLFPHYFLGSNADLPIVGGSILSHDHFQGGHYTFAMAKAPIVRPFTVVGYEEIEAGIVKWPLSVIRLRGIDTDRLTSLADHILKNWRGYTDETAFIFAETDGVPHNTITPIARKNGELYELDLVLRNNITTDEHPLGVFHPHEALHHIKKENIGLIEVMGLAVLPSRLKHEMDLLAKYILECKDLRSNPDLLKHADWVEEFLPSYPTVTEENVQQILQQEIGKVFCRVLEDAGVYKYTPEGTEAFLRFIRTLS